MSRDDDDQYWDKLADDMAVDVASDLAPWLDAERPDGLSEDYRPHAAELHLKDGTTVVIRTDNPRRSRSNMSATVIRPGEELYRYYRFTALRYRHRLLVDIVRELQLDVDLDEIAAKVLARSKA